MPRNLPDYSPSRARQLPAVALTSVLSALWLAGCSTMMPAASDRQPVAAPMQTARLEGADGLKSAAESRQVLREVRAEGRGPEFENHLALLKGRGETLTAGNELKLLIDGPASFEAMFAALEIAEKHVLIESYIFEAEDYGRQIADILLRKSAQGVAVNVIYDSVGSFVTPLAFFDELRAGGVRLCEFNPVSPLRRLTGVLQLNHRDHRKLLVIDERIAFTGGINISSVYSSSSPSAARRARRSAAEEHWRDTHVRIEGPAVRPMLESFHATWARQGCTEELAALMESSADAPSPPEEGDRLVAVIDSPGDGDSTRFYRALLDAIGAATKSVHITMAYFVPDPQLLQALQQAAQRGTEVMLVLPGRSDSLLVLRAGQAHYGELLAAGVRIFELHDELLHAKTAVIDGVWATIGSSNLDLRSFLHNDELNVVILGRQFGAEMEALFARDVEQSRELDLESWNQRGLGRRMMESFGRMWKYWL